MRKWIIASGVVLLLVVVLVVALLNLNSLIKRNKDYLIAQAEQALGRKVSVGEVELTLWNGIGLRLKEFTVADDPSFSSADFVQAGDLQVNVKLMPLLRKELQVKRVILNEPRIGIIRDKKGEFNFSTIGQTGKAEEPREKAAEREKGEAARKKGVSPLVVSLVDISGGEIHYLDRKERIDLVAREIELEMKELDLSKPFSASLAAAVFADKQNVKIQARVGPLQPEAGFDRVPLDGEIRVDPIDLDKLKTAVPQLKASLPRDLGLGGIMRIKDMKIHGTLKNLAFQGTVEATDGTVSYGRNFHKAPGVPLVLTAQADYGSGRLSLRELKLKLHSLELAGKGDLKFSEPAAVNLSLDSNRFSFTGWEKLIPAIEDYQLSGDLEIHTNLQGRVGKGATPQIRGVLSLAGVGVKPPQFPKAVKDLNTRINFTGHKAELRETTLSLGNSKIRLTADIESFAPLLLSYKMSTPEIWPADFQSGLPEERKGDVIKQLTSEGKLNHRNGNLAFHGRIASSQGTLYRIGYKDLGANLALENKIANIRDLRVNALKGSLQAAGEYAFNSSVPQFSLTSKVQGIDLKELYQALDPKAQRDIQGRLNADAKMSGRGNNWDSIKPNLRGQGQAEVVEGALLNFNLAEGVLSGITGIPGLTSLISPRVREKYPETFAAKDTEFKELSAQFNLADGRAQVKNLRITAADYGVRGNGWVDFDRKVDFKSVLVFSQRLSADLAESARETKYLFNSQGQFEIPFALSGTLPRVRPRPDSRYLADLIQRGFVRRGAEELQRQFLGRKESESSQEVAPPDQKKRERGSTEELIRKGLESLFGR